MHFVGACRCGDVGNERGAWWQGRVSARACGYPWEVVSGAGGCGCRAYGARDVAWCWGRVVVGVRMLTQTLGLGFCALGHPA